MHLAIRRLNLGLILTLMLAATGCAALGPLSMLTGGPDVAANTQVGGENRQQLVAVETRTSAGRDVVTKQVEAAAVDRVEITNERIPPWVILLLLVGWLLPSPGEIGRWVWSGKGRKT